MLTASCSMGLDSTYPELTTLKVVYNGLARRVKVPYDMEWNDFEHKVCRLFNISPPLVTSYKDSMGVSVIVDNSDDFFFFLDEEYTGRLDIVTNVEASEASDWTVVRTDTGKALKEIDRSSELSIGDDCSDKSKPGEGSERTETISSASSVRAHSFGNRRIPRNSPDSSPRVFTPEATRTVIQNQVAQIEVEEFLPPDSQISYPKENTSNEDANSIEENPGSSAESIRSSPKLRSSITPSDIVELDPYAGTSRKDGLYSPATPSAEDTYRRDNDLALDVEAASMPIQGEEISYPKTQDHRPLCPITLSSESDHSKEEIEGVVSEGQSLQFSEPGRPEEYSVESSAVSLEEPVADFVLDSAGANTEVEPSVTPTADFQDFAEALVYNFFTTESFSTSPQLEHISPEEAVKSPTNLNPSAGEAPSTHEHMNSQEIPTTEDPELPTPPLDEFTRLKKGHELRQLLFKFDEVFRRHPSLLTTLELFTDQISHGVPIDFTILENGLRRLAPLPHEHHSRAFETAASNLVGSVGSIINHVGSSINSLIDNDLSKLFSSGLSVSKPETRDPAPNLPTEIDAVDISEEETPEARSCHRRHHRPGCKGRKQHCTHVAESLKPDDESASPAAEDLSDGCRQHRRHGRKRKSHICSVHRLDSSPPEKSRPGPTTMPETNQTASLFSLPTIAVCPPKLPVYTACSSSQPPHSTQNDSFASSGMFSPDQAQPNPFVAYKREPAENQVERARRPYSLHSLIPPSTPVLHSAAVQPPRYLGAEVDPADAALISGIVALREMGFPDDAANLDALQAHAGRLEDAIEALISKL